LPPYFAPDPTSAHMLQAALDLDFSFDALQA